jgi:uncharacterized membrane protein YkvA (DUF1232 family)
MSKKAGLIERFKQKSDQLKQEVYALYLAYKDPRVSWYAKIFAACVIGYALSPIDLIPDFIPVLGYLDDLILLPLGIGMALKMIPPAVLAECRQKASERLDRDTPMSRAGAVVVIVIWIFLLVLSGVIAVRLFG